MGLIWALSALDMVTFFKTLEKPSQGFSSLDSIPPPERLPLALTSWRLWRLLYEQPVTEYQSGDTIHLFLYWDGGRVANEPDAGFEVSLADRGGRPWKRVETYVHNLQWHVTWCSTT